MNEQTHILLGTTILRNDRTPPTYRRRLPLRHSGGIPCLAEVSTQAGHLTSKRKTFLIVKNLNQLLLLPLFDMGASHPASRLPGPLFQ